VKDMQLAPRKSSSGNAAASLGEIEGKKREMVLLTDSTEKDSELRHC